MALEPEDKLPADLSVVDSGGSEIPLAAELRGEAALLIYLRHLG